jgi:hypothetical protein
MDTPPAPAAGLIEIEEVAVVLVLVVPVFVPVVVSESVAVFVLVLVPVLVSDEVWDAVFVVGVVSEVAASLVVTSVVSAKEVSVNHDSIRWVLAVPARLSRESPKSNPFGLHGQAEESVPSKRTVQITVKKKDRMLKMKCEVIGRFEDQAIGVVPWAGSVLD